MTSRQPTAQTSSLPTLDDTHQNPEGLALPHQSFEPNIDQDFDRCLKPGFEPSLEDPVVAHQASSDDRPLREVVQCAMRRYFNHLDGSTVTGLHAMVLAEVETPLLLSVLEYTNGNQTRAAEMLGLNRGTLRKKLKHYDLI